MITISPLLNPNYITQSFDYTKSAPKSVFSHGIGLDPNYVTESVEKTKSVPAYNTGFMLNNIKTSKAEPLHKIISRKESHNSPFDNSNNGFEKFQQFTRIDEILTKLEALAVSNKDLANEIRNSNQVLANKIKNAS